MISFKEYFYLAIFCFGVAIPINFLYEEYEDKQKSDKQKSHNDSLVIIETQLRIDLLKKELKKYKHD